MENTVKIPRMETIATTAELLNLPVHFVRAAVTNGDVVSVRAGRKFLVNVDSVIAFLNTGVPQGAPIADSPRRSNPDSEKPPRVSPIPLRSHANLQ